jgi:CHAT domain-containing protein/Flp pilus assembly protein TadD
VNRAVQTESKSLTGQTPSVAVPPQLLFLVVIFLSLHSAQGAKLHGGFYHPVHNQPSPARVQDTQNTPEIKTLELGQSVERQIAGGQTQRFQINLSGAQFAGLSIQQSGIDVVEHLFAPNGEEVADFDDELRPPEAERAEFVAETDGAYRLDVAAKFRGASGRYEIRLTEVRAATDHDRLLFEAHRLETQSANLAHAGKYDDALPVAEQAFEIAEKELGPNHPYVGYLLNVLGNLHLQKGALAKAQSLYQRALEINQKARGPEHPETVRSMRGLGATYGSLNEFQKGEELLQQALKLTEKTFGSDHPNFAQGLFALANFHMRRNDLTRAEREFQQVITIDEKYLETDSLPLELNNLGMLYNSRKEYDRAEPLLQRALEIEEEKLGRDSSELAMPLQNLGLIAQEKRKDYPGALDLYWRAVHVLEKGVGPESPRVAAILNNVANIYKTQGDYAKALEMHQRVYSIFEKALGPHHGSTLVSLGNIARTYASMGDVQDAIKFQALTDEVIEKNLTLNLAIGSERQKLAYFDSLADRTDRTISLHVNMAPGDSTARDLAVVAILQRKGRVLDAMSAGLSALRQRLNSEDQKLLDELNATMAQLAKRELNGPGQTPPEEFRKQVTALEEQKERLESEISRRSAEFRAQTQPVTLAAVQAAIPREAALIELATYRPFNPRLDNLDAYGEPRYVAYIVHQHGEVKWKELGSAKEIESAVEALRDALRDPQRKDVQQRARAVDEKIMQPLRTLLGEATQLLVSADGSLNLIPFAALVDEQGKYLIERYSITYLTSGRDLLRLQVARESKSPPVVVAEPDFGEPAVIESSNGSGTNNPARGNYSRLFFGPLPGVAEEVRALKELLPQAIFLTKESATKAAVEKLSAPSILHIATHGFFLSVTGALATGSQRATRDPTSTTATVDNPLLRSGLALAGANQRNDGILTALEASGLDLWGTRLVVLSACDTGIGEVKRSEGVYGLRRSLVLAGAESQLMSLWPVSDRSTRDLMISYYKNLISGQGRSDSLRQAQLQILKSKSHSHSYYWASFIQTGEWANLEGKR